MSENQYRAGRRKGYTVILRSVAQDKTLSLKARGLFLLMQSLPDDWTMTQNGLAKFAGVGRDQVRAALKELEIAGYLVKSQEHDADGKFSGAVYTLLEERPEVPSEPPRDAVQATLALPQNPQNPPLSENPITGKPSTGNPLSDFPPEQNIYNIYTNYDNKPPISPAGEAARNPQSDLIALFARFWAAYPKKRDKADALRVWKALKPDLALCRKISAGLARWKASDEWTRDNGRYIPGPAKWLRRRRWEDDPGPMAGPAPDNLPPVVDAWRGRTL